MLLIPVRHKRPQNPREMIKRMREQVDLAAGRLEDIFKSGEECINSLLQLQGEQIKTINAQIANSRETLTKGREMLEQMGTSVEKRPQTD